MPIVSLNPSSVLSATGWTGATVANLSTSDDVRATDGVAGEIISVELSDVPADYDSLNNVTLKVEARTSASASRAKSITLDLLDSANNVLETFTTGTIGTTEAVFSSSAIARAATAAQANGWRLRATVLECGGMGDSVTVSIDRLWVEIDYVQLTFASVGSLDATIAPVTLSSSGWFTILGTATPTLGAVTISAVGDLGPAPGSWEAETATWTSITTNWDGTGASNTGELTQSVGVVSLTSTATLTIQGTLVQPLGLVDVTATGSLRIEGELSAAVDPVEVSAAGTLTLRGTVAQTIDPVTLTATSETGDAPIEGTLSATLNPVTVAAVGSLTIEGEFGVTLAAIEVSATGSLILQGALAQTIASVTLAAEGVSGDVPIAGELTQPVGEVALLSAGSLVLRGEVAATLEPIGVSATGSVTIQGLLSSTLDAITLEAAGFTSTPIVGSLGVTISPVTLVSAGVLTALPVYRGFVPNPYEFKRPKKNIFIRPWRTGW